MANLTQRTAGRFILVWVLIGLIGAAFDLIVAALDQVVSPEVTAAVSEASFLVWIAIPVLHRLIFPEEWDRPEVLPWILLALVLPWVIMLAVMGYLMFDTLFGGLPSYSSADDLLGPDGESRLMAAIQHLMDWETNIALRLVTVIGYTLALISMSGRVALYFLIAGVIAAGLISSGYLGGVLEQHTVTSLESLASVRYSLQSLGEELLFVLLGAMAIWAGAARLRDEAEIYRPGS